MCVCGWNWFVSLSSGQMSHPVHVHGPFHPGPDPGLRSCRRHEDGFSTQTSGHWTRGRKRDRPKSQCGSEGLKAFSGVSIGQNKLTCGPDPDPHSRPFGPQRVLLFLFRTSPLRQRTVTFRVDFS